MSIGFVYLLRQIETDFQKSGLSPQNTDFTMDDATTTTDIVKERIKQVDVEMDPPIFIMISMNNENIGQLKKIVSSKAQVLFLRAKFFQIPGNMELDDLESFACLKIIFRQLFSWVTWDSSATTCKVVLLFLTKNEQNIFIVLPEVFSKTLLFLQAFMDFPRFSSFVSLCPLLIWNFMPSFR